LEPRPSFPLRDRRTYAFAEGQGFTLIEVLVAVAIVAVALAAGSRASSALLDNAQRYADVNAAQWCADNRLVNLRLAKQFPDIGETTFECEQLGRAYRGELRVRVTPNPNFRRVEAAIANDLGQPVLVVATLVPRYY
jgi:general secretion pathway protein I